MIKQGDEQEMRDCQCEGDRWTDAYGRVHCKVGGSSAAMSGIVKVKRGMGGKDKAACRHCGTAAPVNKRNATTLSWQLPRRRTGDPLPSSNCFINTAEPIICKGTVYQ